MNNPTLDIRLSQILTDEDRHILLGWSDDPFRISHITWHGRPKDWHILGYADGQLVSHVGLLKDEVTVAQHTVTVGGVGGVVTVPSAQGKGYATQLMQHAAIFMRETLAVEFGLLFCLPSTIPFYQRLGWREVSAPVSIEQASGRVPTPVPVMALPCDVGQAWPSGDVAIGLPW